jgi:aldose 1-epimerase
MRHPLLAVVFSVALSAAATAPARYTAKVAGDIVELRDAKTDTVVPVLTPVSNAYQMIVKGQNVIRVTFASVNDIRARPGLNGIPLLAPFANRLDQQAFYANGKKYNFDMELGNVRGAIPIHGYLTGANGWKVVAARADASSAWVTSTLDFYRNPQYMKQFPFAHTLTMTYRLSEGVLEVRLRIDNLSDEPMPVALGFHPYFQLTDSNRNDWTLSVGAKTHWLLAPTKIPTGETEPAEKFFGGDPHAVSLSRFANTDIDDGFSDLERNAQGRAVAGFKGQKQRIDVELGPNYKAVLIYSTAAAARGPEPGFVAIEPMAGITDALNLAQKGLYKELQSIAARGVWQESFWIRPSGY